MRRFFDMEIEGASAPPPLFEKVDGSILPKEKGYYITNFGNLEFDGETFRMNGDRRFPTTIDWWMRPV